MSRRSPAWRSAPRGHRCKASDLQPGWGGNAVGPAGEPSNARRPRGPKRKEVRLQRRASPLFRVAALSPRICVPSSTPPSPGESGHRTRGQVGEASAARRLFRGSRQRGQREARLLPRVTGRRVSLSRATPHSRPQLVLLPQASGLRYVLRSPHGASGKSTSTLHRASAPSASGPSHMLRRCPGGLRCAPGAATLGPSPHGAQLRDGQPGSWPDHAPLRICLILRCALSIICL
ncbi:hypothetical protein NDU88_003160 [Pleurodeles waltl]|uniref:Uncharacterized protein n=1 Tax=Pleurodeles waltl TaxID=8319 RepID=A0AAV7RC46_PLEWA|nr:hypothetical protein NDU88_003160 [Pleurodeles waltl]